MSQPLFPQGVAIMSNANPKSSISVWLVSRIGYVRTLAKRKVGRDLKQRVGLSDIVNDILAISWKDRNKCEGKTESERHGWLRQVFFRRVANLRRSIATERRDIQREQPISSKIVIPSDHTPALERVMCKERGTAVKAAIALLPSHYQIVVDLRSDQNLSFQEIGTQLGLKTDAAAKLYARAVHRLRETLGPEFDPCG